MFNRLTMTTPVKQAIVCLICVFALSAARNESDDGYLELSLYRLVIEARQTADPTLIYILHKTAPANVPDIEALRALFRAARDQLEGDDQETTEGLAGYRQLVLYGAGLPATLIWGYCSRKSDDVLASGYCNDPVRWLEAASELGDPGAMVHLGWHYARLPEPKMDLALKWFALAAAYRDSGGAAALGYWETKGVYPDSADVQRLIRQWMDADEQHLNALIEKIVAGQ